MSQQSDFAVYVPSQLSPSLFGEVVFIAAATSFPQQFHLEGHLLVEHPTKGLFSVYRTIDTTVPKGCPVQFDLDFAMKEALNLGTVQISAMLQKTFQQSGDWRIFARRFELVVPDEGIHYLIRLWVRGNWLEEWRQIMKKNVSYSDKMKDYLKAIANYPMMTVPSSNT